MAVKQICALILIGAVCALASTIKPDHEHPHKVPTLPGSCPDFPAFATLEPTKLSGDWFIMSYSKVGIEKPETTTGTKRCLKKSLTFTPDGGLTAKMTFFKDNKEGTHSSTGTPVTGKIGKFTMSSEEHPGKTATMTILDTDYTNYAVCLLCKEEDGKHGYIINIVSRQKTLDAPLLEKAKSSLIDAKLPIELTTVEQNC